MDTLQPYSYSAPIQGVKVKPLSEDGKIVKIHYNGLLHDSGAGEVWLHAGFGEVNEWNQVEDIQMEPVNEGWEKTIEMEDNQLNFCFKDHVGNWDNNNGMNWIYRIS